MTGVADAVLVGLIAVLVVIFLVGIVVYGGSVVNQVSVLTQRLEFALVQVEVQFANVLANAVEIFGGLADVAGQAFAGLIPQVVGAFNSVATYFEDQLRSIIKQVQNNVFGTSGQVSNQILAGIQSIGGAFSTTITQIQNFFGSLYNQVLGLMSQAVMFVITLVNAIINQVVNGIASAIVFVVEGIEFIVAQIGQIISTGLAQIPGLINDVEAFFNLLMGGAENGIQIMINALTAFAVQIVNTFAPVPWGVVCTLRCVCSFVPLIHCPITTCCACCPGGSCGACVSGCCPCFDPGFFPANCCTNNSSCGICSCN